MSEKELKILEEFPPNYDQIKERFDLTGTKPLFTYGWTIFNPFKAELRPDLLIHEEIHCKKQGDNPDEWWNKYLTDDEFRLQEEVEAYAIQADFVKKRFKIKDKQFQLFLDSLAKTLSSPMYGNLLSFQKAKTKIRIKQKEICSNTNVLK